MSFSVFVKHGFYTTALDNRHVWLFLDSLKIINNKYNNQKYNFI